MYDKDNNDQSQAQEDAARDAQEARLQKQFEEREAAALDNDRDNDPTHEQESAGREAQEERQMQEFEGPDNSFSAGSDDYLARIEQEKAAADERAKRETPRADKPDTYFLYRNGEMENAYTLATDAMAGLQDAAKGKHEQVYIGDEAGGKYAGKEAVERFSSLNGVQLDDGSRIETTAEFKKDLEQEAAIRERDAASVERAEIEKPDQELARQDGKQLPEPHAAAAPEKQEPARQTEKPGQAWSDLRNATEQFNKVRDTMRVHQPQAWEQKLAAALRETPAPAAPQRQAWEQKLDQQTPAPSQPIAQALAPWQQQLNASAAARESQPQTQEAERQAQQQQAQRQQQQLETPGR